MKTRTSLIGIVVTLYITLVGGIAYAFNSTENIVVQETMKPLIDIAAVNAGDNLKFVEKNDSRIPKDRSKRCPQFEDEFREYGLFPVQVFSYIAWRESGCNPKAINAKFDNNGNVIWTLNKNGSIDRGLLQINSSWKTVTRNVCGTDLNGLLELDCNLKVAKYIMDNSKGKLLNWRIPNN